MDIEKQQCLLAVLGCYRLRRAAGTLAIDGIPGPATRDAVVRFQKSHALEPDGVWGPLTQAAVLKALPEALEVPEPEGEIPSWWEKYPAVHREDWRCRCAGRYCSGYPAEPHEQTVALLQQISDHFGRELLWNSGLRCPRYNREIPGASPRSKHCLGMAYDFHMEGVSPRALYDYADSLLPDSGGIGLYSWGIHLDDRPVKARWKG